MLNQLFVLLLLLGYSTAQYDPSFAIASSWSMWSPWSFCSNNVMIRVRACSTFRGFKCIGHNKEFQSCNSGVKPSNAGESRDYDHEDHQDREQAMRQLYQDYEPSLPDHPHTAPRFRKPAPARPAPVQPIEQYAAPGTRDLVAAPQGSMTTTPTPQPPPTVAPTSTSTVTTASNSQEEIATPGLRKYKAQYVTKTPTTTPLNTITEESSEFSEEYDESPTLFEPVKHEAGGVAQAPITPRTRPATGVPPVLANRPNGLVTRPAQVNSPPAKTHSAESRVPVSPLEQNGNFHNLHHSQITVMGTQEDFSTVLTSAKTVGSHRSKLDESRPRPVLPQTTLPPVTTETTPVPTTATTTDRTTEADSGSGSEEEEEFVKVTPRPAYKPQQTRGRVALQGQQSFPIVKEVVTATTTIATTTTTTTTSQPPTPQTGAVPVEFRPMSRQAKIFEIKRPFVSDTGRIPANFFTAKQSTQVGRGHSGEFSAVQHHLAPLQPLRARLPEARTDLEKKRLLEETATLEQKIKDLEKKVEQKKRKKQKEVITTEDDVLVGDTARALSWMIANMTSQMEMGNMPIMDMIPLDRVEKKRISAEQADLKRRLMKENKDLRVVQAGVINHPLPNGVEITPDFPEAAAYHGIVKVEPKKKHSAKKRKIVWSNWTTWSDCRCGAQLRKRVCITRRKADGKSTSCPPAQHERRTCLSEDNCSL